MPNDLLTTKTEDCSFSWNLFVVSFLSPCIEIWLVFVYWYCTQLEPTLIASSWLYCLWQHPGAHITPCSSSVEVSPPKQGRLLPVLKLAFTILRVGLHTIEWELKIGAVNLLFILVPTRCSLWSWSYVFVCIEDLKKSTAIGWSHCSIVSHSLNLKKGIHTHTHTHTHTQSMFTEYWHRLKFTQLSLSLRLDDMNMAVK
jgi:hypothetical protein